MRLATIALTAALLPAWAQEIKMPVNLDALEQKAEESVTVTMDKSMLKLAGRFLKDDEGEADVRKLVGGLEGIYVRSFEFKTAGAYSQADLDNVRNQLKAPEWSRIVEVKSAEDGETSEVYLRTVDKKVSGVAILSAEPKELTVANIVGAVDLDSLADLSGHFGLPKLKEEKQTHHM